jgi:hypothetical protein
VAGKIDAYKLTDGHLHIIDHKTRSNFKWALTEEQLRVDGQGNFYAEALRRSPDIPEFESVSFSHNNIGSRGAIAHRFRTADLSFDLMSEMWERSEERAVTMGEFIPVENQDDVPANTNSCRKYGRLCPFAEHCNAHNKKSSPKALFSAVALLGSRKDVDTTPVKTGGPMSLLARMREKAVADSEAAKAAPETPSKPQATEPDNATQITSTESAAYDPSMVSGAFLKEVRDILEGMRKGGVPIVWAVVTGIAKKEGIPEEFWPCLGAVLDVNDLPEEFEPLCEEDESLLLSGATAAEIMGASSEASPDENANPLVESLSALPPEALAAAVEGLSEADKAALSEVTEGFSPAQMAILADLNNDTWEAACKDKNPDYIAVCEWILTHKKHDGNLDLVNSAMRDSGVFKRSRTPSAKKIMALLINHPHIREGSDGNYLYVGDFEPTEPKGDESSEITIADITEVSGSEEIQRALGLVAVCEDLEVLRGALGLVTPQSRRAKALRKRLRDLGEDCPEPQPTTPETGVDRDYTAPKPPPEKPPAPPKTQTPEPTPPENPVKHRETTGEIPAMVFLGCIPMGMDYRDFMDIDRVSAAVDAVNNATMSKKGLSWTLYNDYGDSGPKRVVDRIMGDLSKGHKIPGGAWFLDKNSPLVSADVAGVLRAAGVVVVRQVF